MFPLVGQEVVDGVATDLGLNPQSLPPLAESATLWVRVISDGTDVTVKAIENAGEPSEGAWSNATVYYQTSSSTNRFSWFGGGFGFRGNSYNSADIDSLTLKTDRDADGTYENTELEESFTLDSNGMAPTEPTYDKAGNLTYDGRFKYAYDGWNRLVTVEKAYRTASDDGAGGVTLGAVQTGSVVQEVAYDGLGRRIVNAVKNSGDLSMTYHYYYDGQRLIETRNGSDQVLKQYVWAPQTGGAGGSAGGYVDELVHIRVNDSPATSQYCTVEYWALTGVNHNVLGVIPNLRLAASPQRLVERYEYTPYGQRQVFKSAGLNDPDTSAPTAMSQRLGYGGAPGEPGSTHPYGLNPFGHQGLYHDPTTGLIVNNERYRHPRLGRFTSRDPIDTPLVSHITRTRQGRTDRYVDGMNLYQMLGGNPVNNVDPKGLETISVIFGGFIHQQLGNWRPEPIPGSPWEYKTDQRGFGGGSFRVYGFFAFESTELGSIDRSDSNGFVGSFTTTRRRPKSSGGYTYQTKQEKPLGGVGFKNTGAVETTWKLAAQGNYPFAPRGNIFLAAVDFHVEVRIACKAPGKLEVEISGWHDAFPFFEGVVEGDKTLYRYRSPAPGPSPKPGALGPGGNVNASNTITIDAETQ